MKRFIARVVLEFAIVTAAVIAAAQFVKSEHPAVGLGILAIYGMIGLYRLGIEKINAQRDRNIKEAQVRRLEADLSVKEAQIRCLEPALIDAASEALWVSDIAVRDKKVVYKIDIPGRGHFVIYLPVDDVKTEDAPAAPQEG